MVSAAIAKYNGLTHEEKDRFLKSLTAEDLELLTNLWTKKTRVAPAVIERCRGSLYEFVKRAWKELEGGELHTNWHQALICEYLESQFWEPEKFQNVLINIQPRVLKSMICSVFFPCWIWLHRPHTRFLCISYASSLSNNHNFLRRILIQSDFYQQCCKDRKVVLQFGKNRISEFQNTYGGEMLSRGLDSAVTGVGGDFLIFDDPNNPETVESEVQREKNVMNTKAYMTTRKNFPDAPILVIQQRTHRLDVSGWILKERPEFKKLILPTKVFKNQGVYFPRQKILKTRPANSLLDPDWFGQHHIDEAMKTLGPDIYAARYQQEPIPPGGGIIKKKYFQRYTAIPAFPDFWIASWDTAQKKEETSKPWAMVLAAIANGRIYIADYYCDWHEYPDGERALVSLALKWNLPRKPHALLIEDKSTGSTLVQRLRTEAHLAKLGLSPIPMLPDKDKIARMTVEAPVIAAGRLYLPEVAPWLVEFEDVMISFPQGELMDPVDALSQLIKYARESGFTWSQETEMEADQSGVSSGRS